MTIDKNSRQMPTNKSVVSQQNYSDLLFAWLQCNSEKVGEGKDFPQRRILKKRIKWQSIENDFTRVVNGKEVKAMGRKTIKKYFEYFISCGLVIDNGDSDLYYYLKVMDRGEAALIEYRTLNKLMNVFKNDSITIYCYLLNRYFANGCQGYDFTISQIKDYLGRTTLTTSNNNVVVDTLDILQRLSLIEYTMTFDPIQTRYQYKLIWLVNKLPD